MKNVFTNTSEIAHLWANQLQTNARNSANNFYFDNDKIYSYGSHFVIAKHVTNNDGLKAVLFTENSYSNTTAKHISIVRSASNHLNKIYCFHPNGSHNENFLSWTKQIERIAVNLLKAKKPEIYLNQIDSVKSTANKYAAFFGIDIPPALLSAYSITDKSNYSQYVQAKETREKEQALIAKKESELRNKKALIKWLKGETTRLYGYNGNDYLRVNFGRVETTQAVEIPIELAVKLYEKIKSNTLKVGDKFMNYEVLKTGKETTIGCHTFKTSYLLTFGSKLTTVSTLS